MAGPRVRVTMGSVTTSLPGSPGPATVRAEALRRRRSGRLVAGVAGGIADHLGVQVLWVRAAFVALMAVSGAGVIVPAPVAAAGRK